MSYAPCFRPGSHVGTCTRSTCAPREPRASVACPFREGLGNTPRSSCLCRRCTSASRACCRTLNTSPAVEINNEERKEEGDLACCGVTGFLSSFGSRSDFFHVHSTRRFAMEQKIPGCTSLQSSGGNRVVAIMPACRRQPGGCDHAYMQTCTRMKDTCPQPGRRHMDKSAPSSPSAPSWTWRPSWRARRRRPQISWACSTSLRPWPG